MEPPDVRKFGLDDSRGVVLGQASNGDRLYYNGDADIMVFARKGAGKGIGFVLPNLRDYEGSMVVLDPKGENTIVSAALRRSKGHRVVVLDPFGKTTPHTGIPSDTYNPLSALTYADPNDLGPGIEAMADALIIVSPHEREPHFTMGGKKFLAFLMWFMVAHLPPEDRNLITLYDLAHGGREKFDRIATVMTEGRSKDPNVARVCRALGNWYQGRTEREFSYFESVSSNHLGWLGDFVWSSVLAGPPSPPLPLKTQKITLYLVLPFERVERYQRWLRLMVADCLATLYATHGAPKLPVFFLFDEAAAGLGKMDVLLNATAASRSFGARLCFVYQNFTQVSDLYGAAYETFIANAGVKLFFSVDDMKAAEFIARRCGQKTTPVPGVPQGVAEPLIRVEQIFQLPPDEIIGLITSAPPARFGRLNVWTDNRYAGLAPNATHGEPEERIYTARTDYEPVDLSKIKAKRSPRLDDAYEPQETESEQETSAPGSVVAKNADASEIAALAALSNRYKRYVFKHENGRVGYLDDNNNFVPVDAG